MILIKCYKYFYRECISKDPSRFLFFSKSSYDKPLIDFPIVHSIISLFELFITKYIKEDLQKIFKLILKAHISLFDGSCKKPLKAESSNIYCDKFHMEYYNFCQQFKDYFSIVKVKGLNYIFFAVFFLYNYINFC